MNISLWTQHNSKWKLFNILYLSTYFIKPDFIVSKDCIQIVLLAASDCY